jgi:hypothetical protein
MKIWATNNVLAEQILNNDRICIIEKALSKRIVNYYFFGLRSV